MFVRPFLNGYWKNNSVIVLCKYIFSIFRYGNVLSGVAVDIGKVHIYLEMFSSCSPNYKIKY